MTTKVGQIGAIDANNVRLLDSEFLGKYLANEMAGVLRKTDELCPVFEELWRRFEGLKDGENICGCSTRTQYCETVLKRSMRSVQYILYGRQERGDRPSPTVTEVCPPDTAEPEKIPFDVRINKNGLCMQFSERFVKAVENQICTKCFKKFRQMIDGEGGQSERT